MLDAIRNITNLIADFWPNIHKEGYPFIFIFLVVTMIIWAAYAPLGFVGLVLTAWCVYFFRDPERVIPLGDSFVISPADGMVQKIEKVALPEELDLDTDGKKKVYRISVFLNVFDVHVNRVPVSGTITQISYHPGKFLSANLEKASLENERNHLVIDMEGGKRLVCTQIAGLVARRIVCEAEEKQVVKAGERYGLIRFGSRADIYLPEGVNPLVVEGQRMIGGETILADTKGKIAARKGEVR
jgi:phosphatidylserine decarboxylase